jgi:hypothetical protein
VSSTPHLRTERDAASETSSDDRKIKKPSNSEELASFSRLQNFLNGKLCTCIGDLNVNVDAV